MQRDADEGSGLLCRNRKPPMVPRAGSVPETAPRGPFLPVPLLLHRIPHSSQDLGMFYSSWHLPWHQLVQAQHFLSLVCHSKWHHYSGMEKADIFCGVWGWRLGILAPLRRDRELHGSELRFPPWDL